MNCSDAAEDDQTLGPAVSSAKTVRDRVPGFREVTPKLGFGSVHSPFSSVGQPALREEAQSSAWGVSTRPSVQSAHYNPRLWLRTRQTCLSSPQPKAERRGACETGGRPTTHRLQPSEFLRGGCSQSPPADGAVFGDQRQLRFQVTAAASAALTLGDVGFAL